MNIPSRFVLYCSFMQVIEAPIQYAGNSTTLFLAGGISDCPDWQTDMCHLLRDTSLVLFNPRRTNFPIDDPAAAEEQIRWEFEHLRKATMISFWFPCETLNPIVLYELGAWSMTSKPIFIGVHPDYPRRQDVEIQTRLVRPEVQVVYTLELLAAKVIHHVY